MTEKRMLYCLLCMYTKVPCEEVNSSPIRCISVEGKVPVSTVSITIREAKSLIIFLGLKYVAYPQHHHDKRYKQNL